MDVSEIVCWDVCRKIGTDSYTHLDVYKRQVMLRVLGGLSFHEIGEIFETTENWGRVTYYRAKEKLREKADSENAGR